MLFEDALEQASPNATYMSELVTLDVDNKGSENKALGGTTCSLWALETWEHSNNRGNFRANTEKRK